MQRYLIILLCLLSSSIVYYLLFKILQILKVKNANYLGFLVSITFFIVIMLFSFLYFEPHNNVNLRYTPPKVIDGKIKEGNFK